MLTRRNTRYELLWWAMLALLAGMITLLLAAPAP